jgi:hypothetical protein
VQVARVRLPRAPDPTLITNVKYTIFLAGQEEDELDLEDEEEQSEDTDEDEDDEDEMPKSNAPLTARQAALAGAREEALPQLSLGQSTQSLASPQKLTWRSFSTHPYISQTPSRVIAAKDLRRLRKRYKQRNTKQPSVESLQCNRKRPMTKYVCSSTGVVVSCSYDLQPP